QQIGVHGVDGLHHFFQYRAGSKSADMHVTNLRNGRAVQLARQSRNRNNEAAHAKAIELAHGNAAESERKERRSESGGKAEKLPTAPRSVFVRWRYRAARMTHVTPNEIRHEQNGN